MAVGITIQPLLMKFQPIDVMDLLTIKVKAFVIQVEFYNVLIDTMVLYPIDFTIDFWNGTTLYDRLAIDAKPLYIHASYPR